MSMTTQQPHTPSPPKNRSRFKDEWNHWVDMPLLQFCLLVLPTLIFVLINPLLPLAAYALYLWAGASWTWRDRWASVWVWAKQGSVFVTFLIGIAWLVAAHLWFFPDVVAVLQTVWHMYVPGDLSLSPFDGHALLARSVLLLPLAPALSLFYEWIDPRTQMYPQRVLTPAELHTPPSAIPVPPLAPTTYITKEVAPTTDETTKTTQVPSKTKGSRTSRTKHVKSQESHAEQMTIDSVLATGQTPPPSEKKKKGDATPNSSDGQQQRTEEVIDWDDLAE